MGWEFQVSLLQRKKSHNSKKKRERETSARAVERRKNFLFRLANKSSTLVPVLFFPSYTHGGSKLHTHTDTHHSHL